MAALTSSINLMTVNISTSVLARTTETTSRATSNMEVSMATVTMNLRRIEDILSKMSSLDVQTEVEDIARLAEQISLESAKLQERVNILSVKLVKERLYFLLCNSQDLPHIILLGKPGAGKGTLSQTLSKKLGYVHVSIGDIHRSENTIGSEIGLKIRDCVSRKDFFGRDMVQITKQLLDPKFEEMVSKGQRFILDNFPTALAYLDYLYEVMDKHQLNRRIILIVPEISELDSVSRLINRIVCSSCNAIYNLETEEFKPKEAGKCDGCNASLTHRIDDKQNSSVTTTISSYQSKIDIFKQYIQPVIVQLAKSTRLESFVLDNGELKSLIQKI